MLDKILNNIDNVFNKFSTKSFDNNSNNNNINASSNINSNNNINDKDNNDNNNNNNNNSFNENICTMDDISNPASIEIDDTEFRRNKGKTFIKVYFSKNKNVRINLNKLKRRNLNRIPARFSLANPFNRIKQFNISNEIIKQKKHVKGSNLSKSDVKSRNKVFSVTFVPHSPGKIKTLKVSNLYIKFAVVWILFLAVSIYSISTFINTWNENKFLKASIDAINSKNTEQIALLNEKYAEIANLLEKGEETNIDISALSEQYRAIIEKYVTGRISGSIASRSGDRTDKTFLTDIKELNNILSELSEVNTSKENLMIDLSEVEEKLRDYLDSLPTQWPVNSRISSPFGTRRDPITGRRAYHKGIDLAANYGTNIKAAGAGKVTYVGSYNELGLTVIIDHGNGIKSLYGHTSKTLVKKGQTVTKDTIVAKVGSSGRSTGAHLHFEIRINDTPVDPLNYLESK